MEVVIFCVTLTAIMCVCLVAMGYVVGREVNDDVADKNMDERADVSNSSELSDACNRDRRRSGDNGCDQSVEEVIDVLNTLRVGTTSREKRAIDYAAECVIVREKLIRFIEERSKA